MGFDAPFANWSEPEHPFPISCRRPLSPGPRARCGTRQNARLGTVNQISASTAANHSKDHHWRHAVTVPWIAEAGMTPVDSARSQCRRGDGLCCPRRRPDFLRQRLEARTLARLKIPAG